MTALTDSAAPAPGTTSATPALRPHRIPADGLYEGPRLLRRTPDGWDDRPYERFEVLPQAATIGAEIRGLDLSRPLSAELRTELNRALLEWKVLFFRGQRLSSPAQREFARNWGELETNPLLAPGDSKDVVRFDKAAGGVPTFENVWHTDVTFRERPAMGAVLQLRAVPPAGGDTMWADMAAAYDNLPPEIRARINEARAVHDYLPGFARFYSPAQLAPFQEEFPPVTHPVVRRHPETGRRMLFVNASFTTRIVGLGRAASDRLLRLLFQQAQVPEYQVRWRWQPGDLAFWDNRATQHYAVNDYGTHRRVAERVAIAGDRPY
ncbi:taurine dioxygenase [Streptomyces sp. RPA4-5]|uniref:TauD/TfdA dioxygenase family protein n=1 Tax=unclassified Streptomyces TaxID=2593676 RepID=UPI00143EEC0D|nr:MULTISPECIES: TauD/TfdA family dioxygenase [unclassified Streptomyces]QIY55424.1 taurine dioxygenase [Streptomyces sp. RPA4-5]WJY38155.1 TauD/TfdA family dioxygenase [Streptomyces sp. P9-2B-2]